TNEFSQVKQLKDESKFKQALKIINELEDKKGLTLQDQFEIHYLKSSLLSELGYFNEALKYVELAYKESQQLKNNLQIIKILISKIILLLRCTRIKEAQKTIIKTEQVLNTFNQISSIEYKEKYAYLVLLKGRCHWNMGDFNRSLEYANTVLKIAKEIQNDMLKLQAVKLFGFNYSMKGDYERNLENNKRYLALAKKVNDKQELIGALNSLGMVLTEKNEFDQALDYLKQSLSTCDEINSFKTAAVLGSLFDLYLKMNNFDKAQQCLDRMKQIKNQEDIKWFDDNYRLGKAMMLRKKPQDINQLKAKEIFKQIVDEEGTFIEFNYVSLIHLCDQYLADLSKSNDLKALDEIQPYITQLMNIAKNQQSFWLLVEGYTFQAKLKLIIFEFREAQNLLSKALNIAEKYGQERLAKRILNEQDELSKNFIKWEKLKASGANMSERMDLARIDEQIEIMLQKRRYLKEINGQS
ncbi:MAG: tetratricopeptide repeat protein, partial [Candidatus Lokiarchaeota archaeon]|nr:tetratricopeptide repeat protein [Candidatus Lokiarchaeota archaeon]